MFSSPENYSRHFSSKYDSNPFRLPKYQSINQSVCPMHDDQEVEPSVSLDNSNQNTAIEFYNIISFEKVDPIMPNKLLPQENLEYIEYDNPFPQPELQEIIPFQTQIQQKPPQQQPPEQQPPQQQPTKQEHIYTQPPPANSEKNLSFLSNQNQHQNFLSQPSFHSKGIQQDSFDLKSPTSQNQKFTQQPILKQSQQVNQSQQYSQPDSLKNLKQQNIIFFSFKPEIKEDIQQIECLSPIYQQQAHQDPIIYEEQYSSSQKKVQNPIQQINASYQSQIISEKLGSNNPSVIQKEPFQQRAVTQQSKSHAPKIFDHIAWNPVDGVSLYHRILSRNANALKSKKEILDDHLKATYDIKKHYKHDRWSPNRGEQCFSDRHDLLQLRMVLCIVCKEFVRPDKLEKHADYCQASSNTYQLNNQQYFTKDMKLKYFNENLLKIAYLIQINANQMRDYTAAHKDIRLYSFYILDILTKIANDDDKRKINEIHNYLQDILAMLNIMEQYKISQIKDLIQIFKRSTDLIVEKIDLLKAQ